ncbi:hypothetical protein PTSG_03059 [Salpingoeca rosetta]|uniref:HhH-GPD domain-containing protein n=1 Tax=Salpingoeca rosetta (strain ATCC 50818 / BSB-021) TaxID=946362 RepID=F2U450_SALR5|nr:uncharacterized protein PTSG_03059 [Salpingoeca rosetta]EGD82416.1 hypothetical protein PTSG_03059 [Salpingoeca rosetta]|eukprot:XP_004995652.1 hypothetical protein PTSG_03059 [Salpingoeca rosetta]
MELSVSADNDRGRGGGGGGGGGGRRRQRARVHAVKGKEKVKEEEEAGMEEEEKEGVYAPNSERNLAQDGDVKEEEVLAGALTEEDDGRLGSVRVDGMTEASCTTSISSTGTTRPMTRAERRKRSAARVKDEDSVLKVKEDTEGDNDGAEHAPLNARARYSTTRTKPVRLHSTQASKPTPGHVNRGESHVVCSSLTTQSTPFLGFPHPTPAECKHMHDALVQLYGPRTRPPHHRAANTNLLDSLVRTILSQNTTDSNSSAAFRNLKQTFPTWEDVHSADVGALEAAIRSAGLAQTKSRRIKSILDTLHAEHGKLSLEYLRELPSHTVKEQLARFKGVGPKTISCLLLFAMQRPDMAVDTHVFRLAKRAGWVPSDVEVRKHNRVVEQEQSSCSVASKNSRKRAKRISNDTQNCSASSLHSWPGVTRETTYEHLNATVPDDLKYALHLLLIHHGRRVCKSQGCLAKSRRRRPKQEATPAEDISTTTITPSCPVCGCVA